MIVLGIETSCDETSIAILSAEGEKIDVLSNVVSSQIKLHAPYGGVVPNLAVREHIKNLPAVLTAALSKRSESNGLLSIEDIDLIAVTSGPGLIASLLIGTTFAQALAWKYDKPIIGVNHMEGHIYSNWLLPVGDQQLRRSSSTEGRSPDTKSSGLAHDKQMYPALCLIVSGGHTQLTLMKNHGKYQTIGSTLDDASGEAFDKIARILGLSYPGGPAIAKAAEGFRGEGSGLGISLPRPMLNSKNFDFSFSGLKTAVLYLVRDLLKAGHTLEDIRNEVAHEAQEAITDVLVSKTFAAAEKYKVKSIMLSGGVSANKVLRKKLQETAQTHSIPLFIPEMQYTTDNAAMIAVAGYFSSRRYKLQDMSYTLVQADANWEIL